MSITYDNILNVVEAFYAKATTDIIIGFHFRKIKDFDTHFPRIAHFWEMQLLGQSSEKVEPPFDLINVHIPLKFTTAQLNRWVMLFEETLAEFRSRDGHHVEEYLRWKEKIYHFKEKFLASPQLFGPPDA